MSEYDDQPILIRMLLRFIGGSMLGAMIGAGVFYYFFENIENPLKTFLYVTFGVGILGVILPDPFWDWLADSSAKGSSFSRWWPW